MTAEGHYETQGYYPRRGTKRAREWCTHIGGMTLDTARLCYIWFKRLTEEADWDGPNNARIVNSLTGEVVEAPVLEKPVKLPGHRLKTIQVTEEEFDETRRRLAEWGSYTFVSVLKNGDTQYRTSRDYIVGYECVDGTFRVRPREYKPVPKDIEIAA